MGKIIKDIPEKYKGKPIYSISRLETYHNCQYSFYQQYILKQKGRDNIYALLGSFIHEALEKLQFDAINKEEVISQFQLKIFEMFEIQGFKFPTEKIQKNFTECITHYLKHYQPIKCREFKSEERFYTDINGIVLTGFIDGIVFYDNGSVNVIDYKTSTKYSGKELHNHARQLILYAYALEKEYGIKVDKIMFNMVKYVTVTWQGATVERRGFYQRNQIVKSLRNEFKKDLRKHGMSEPEIDMLLEKAESANDITLLPEYIQNKYVITDGYVEYPLTTETMQALTDFVIETVAKIESTPIIESEWKAKNITKYDSFFCNFLCNYRINCPHYKKFLEENMDSFEKQESDDDEMKRLFG